MTVQTHPIAISELVGFQWVDTDATLAIGGAVLALTVVLFWQLV